MVIILLSSLVAITALCLTILVVDYSRAKKGKKSYFWKKGE